MPLMLSPTGNSFIAPPLSFSDKLPTLNQRGKSSGLGCQALSIRENHHEKNDKMICLNLPFGGAVCGD